MGQPKYVCYFFWVWKLEEQGSLPSRTCFLLLVLPAVKQTQNYLQLYIIFWQYLCLSQHHCVIKAHQEFLVSASAVVSLVEMRNRPKVPELLILLIQACRTNFKTQTQRRISFGLSKSKSDIAGSVLTHNIFQMFPFL